MIPTDILNYRIVRHLGTGGMGSVYLAVNTNIDQQVAIKILRPEVARNEELRARFKQEAELLCSLDHPGIVKFLNYVETTEGVFLIMEYVKGTTLENFINKKNGLIVEEKAYPLICEILDAFAYAHSKGIVHRDIKPSNIIIQEDGHIKIMDFGIAQIVSEVHITDCKYVMGTPAYMSPEQIYGKNIDVRSDIYSIGVLIHNMLTGRAPYDSTMLTAQEIKRRVVKDTMPRMADFYPYISDKIQGVVDKATQKIPEARYQSCLEMKAAVKKAIAPDPVPRPLICGGIAFIIVLLAVMAFTWDYYRTKIEYYRDYVEVFGIPQGIGNLSDNEMSHREASYRFEYSRHKLRRVSYVNSKGNLTIHQESEDKDRIIDMTLSYTEGSGKVDAVKYMDQSGKVLYVKDYDSKLKTCTFKLDDELGTEMTLNAQVQLFQSSFDAFLEGKSKISKYILEYNEKGYLTKVEYAGFGNIRVPDGQGLFGKYYVFDEKGRVVEEYFLGKDGKPKATQFGLGTKKFTYDENDNLAKIEYLTIDGLPSSDGNNCPIVLLTYDRWGNRIAEKYTDKNGQPMVRKDNPFAGVLYEYNEEGFCTKRMYSGVDGGLTYIQGVSGCANEYDENGYLTQVSYIDAHGNASYFDDKETETSYSRLKRINDSKGNPLSIELLNSDGEPIEASTWTQKICTYDSIGNLLTEYYINKDGGICTPAKLGYAGFEVAYNKQGRISRLTYMDENKMRTTRQDIRICYFTKEYDARGNFTRISYYDEKDNPILSNEGIAVACYEYDENGNESARYFLDEKGNPCVLNNYSSRVEYTYDEQGNCTSKKFKNTNGKLMLVNGVACYNWEYDQRGNIIKEYPMGLNGTLPAGKKEMRLKYDERDNVIERSYFNTGNKVALCEDGYHKAVMKYNSNNLCIQEEYYGTNDKLKNVNGQNYAVVKREFDKRGNIMSLTFFTQAGTRGNDNAKVHKYYNRYDKIVNKINHQISFGSDGKPIIANDYAAEGRLEYDKRGNRTKLVCYDGYGKKTDGLCGWCEMQFTYNEAGDKISEAFFDLDGKAVLDKQNKYHKATYTYNDMRMISSMSFWGTNGKPIVVSEGYSIAKYKYNKQNQRTEVAYWGTNGQPVNTNNGWHKEVYYFRNGTEYKCDLYDAGNRKIASAVKVNNKWNIKGIEETNTDWRIKWERIAKEFSNRKNSDLTFEIVSIDSNMVTVGIIFYTLSSEQITEEMINKVHELMPILRKETGTPSYIGIQINIQDKYNNKVTTL